MKDHKISKTDDKLEQLKGVVQFASERDINEAETRHKVIDFIIHDFLSWPKNRVAVEEFIAPGFADYVLKKTNGDDLLFIEANGPAYSSSCQSRMRMTKPHATFQLPNY